MKRIGLYILLIFVLVGCKEETYDYVPPVSTRDSLPFPYSTNRDTTIAAGDNFYDFCNGAWLAAHPVPAKGIIGTIAEAEQSLRESVDSRVKDDASQAETFVNAQIAKMAKPASREEALRMIGKQLMEGLPCDWAQLEPAYKKGKIMLTLSGIEKNAAELVIAGTGIDRSLVEINEADKALANETAEELYILMQKCWKQCLAYTQADLEPQMQYTVSYRLAQAQVTEANKSRCNELMKELVAAYKLRMDSAKWLSDNTRKQAIAKAEALTMQVMSPDKWYTDCVVDWNQCQSVAEAAQQLLRANRRLMAQLAGGKDMFTLSLLTEGLHLVRAKYVAETQTLIVYPAFMLPPLVPAGVSESCLYATFCAVASAMMEGLQDEWVTVAEQMHMDDQLDLLVRCYNKLELDPVGHPGVSGDGQRTLRQNLADLGGFTVALTSYETHLSKGGYFGPWLNEQSCKFCEAYAHLYCTQYSNDAFTYVATQDSHSHGRLRVNGVVMNSDRWQKLYGVTSANMLYLPEDKRAQIW